MSSVKAGKLLLLEEEVTDSSVLSPARLMVVDEKVLLLWMSVPVWTTEEKESPCVRVEDRGSWGSLSISVCIPETTSQDTAGGESDASFQFLLLVPVMALTAAEVSGSVDSLRASTDPALTSVWGCD